MTYFYFLRAFLFLMRHKNNLIIMKKFSLLFLFITTIVFSQEQFTTGLLLDKEKYEKVEMTAPLTTRSLDNLPASHSLKSYCPTPLSQGSQPSCVGWASGYGARTISNAIKNKWANNIAKINENTYSPAFVYNIIKGKDDINCKNGSYVSDAMMLMKQYGILKLNEFSYNQLSCTTLPSDNLFLGAALNKIANFERLANWDNPSNLALKVKKAISNNNPVVIGMQISSSFHYTKGTWSGVQTGNVGGHAMVVVGYDDDKDGGAFEIMNSWGSTWGNSGFIWVKYNSFETYVKTAYVMVDQLEQPKPNEIALQGSLKIQLSNGTQMKPELSPDATRNFNIVAASKSTYKITDSYPSGTQFRIYFNSEQASYIYLIGYGGSDKSVNLLYPFDSYSAYFGYSKSEVALPNEDYFIEIDDKPGKDILCILYSKKPLDINSLLTNLKQQKGEFTSDLKSIIKPYIYAGEDLKFASNAISFKAASANSNASIVPIFIEINHK